MDNLKQQIQELVNLAYRFGETGGQLDPHEEREWKWRESKVEEVTDKLLELIQRSDKK